MFKQIMIFYSRRQNNQITWRVIADLQEIDNLITSLHLCVLHILLGRFIRVRLVETGFNEYISRRCDYDSRGAQ